MVKKGRQNLALVVFDAVFNDFAQEERGEQCEQGKQGKQSE